MGKLLTTNRKYKLKGNNTCPKCRSWILAKWKGECLVCAVRERNEKLKQEN